jgi:L-asparaginase/Glu-tRNA(Gln) amidotransferase subunit D
VARCILFAEGCEVDDGQVDGVVVDHGWDLMLYSSAS